MVEVWHSANDM